jgi:hypothetical protein
MYFLSGKPRYFYSGVDRIALALLRKRDAPGSLTSIQCRSGDISPTIAIQ